MSVKKGIVPEQWAETNIVPFFRRPLGRILLTTGQYPDCHYAQKFLRKLAVTSCIGMFSHIYRLSRMDSFGTDPARQIKKASFHMGGRPIQDKAQLDTVYTYFFESFPERKSPSIAV